MRLFIAFDISEEAKKHIEEIQSSIDKKLGKFSFVNSDNCHLTLKFLGEVKETEFETIKSQLKKVDFNKFSLELNKLGFFPDEKYLRVLWVDFKNDEDVLSLQKRIDTVLSDFFPKEKKFKSHVTILRIKYILPENKEKFVKLVKNIAVKKIDFEVSSFKLYKSTLTPNGSIYEVVEEYLMK